MKNGSINFLNHIVYSKQEGAQITYEVDLLLKQKKDWEESLSTLLMCSLQYCNSSQQWSFLGDNIAIVHIKFDVIQVLTVIKSQRYNHFTFVRLITML